MSLDFTFEDIQFENKRREAAEFEPIARELRRDIIKSLTMAKSGHSGGAMGLADIFSVLYFGGVMKYDPQKPDWEERDRFILSAGHICPVQYASLARAGFFPIEELKTLRKYGSRLQGHPAMDVNLPGIESATGSLGHGISIAVGMAISDKLVDKNHRKVFTIIGDGEAQEGSVWEAAMAAGNYNLDNFCCLIDNNDCQIDGRVEDVMCIYPIKEKFEAFGFETIEIDGHNYEEIVKAFDWFKNNCENKIGKPSMIIAKTYMGQGASFMRDDHGWHGIPPNKEQALKALEELK